MMRHPHVVLWSGTALVAVPFVFTACSRCTDESAPGGSATQPPLGSASTTSGNGGTLPGAEALAPTESQGEEEASIEMPEPPSLPEARADASGPDANREIFADYGFPGFSDLTHLCGKRSLETGGGRVVWDAFSTPETPAVVVEHYQQWLGTRGFEAESPGGIWRLPPGALVPDRTLRVYPPTSTGRHQLCEQPPSKEAQSLIVIERH